MQQACQYAAHVAQEGGLRLHQLRDDQLCPTHVLRTIRAVRGALWCDCGLVVVVEGGG